MQSRGWEVDILAVAETMKSSDPAILHQIALDLLKFSATPLGKFVQEVFRSISNEQVDKLIDTLPENERVRIIDAQQRGQLIVLRELIQPGLGLARMVESAAENLASRLNEDDPKD